MDLGERRVGVALSDSDRMMSTPYSTIQRVGDRGVEHGEILDLVSEFAVTTIVVGMPLSLDGSNQGAARTVQSEVKGLRKRLAKEGLKVEVDTIDERFTTVTANQQLQMANVPESKRRAMVDQVAASILLQAWLDRSRP